MPRIAKCLLYECVWGLVFQKGGFTLSWLSTSAYNNVRDQETSDQGATSWEIPRTPRMVSRIVSTSEHHASCMAVNARCSQYWFRTVAEAPAAEHGGADVAAFRTLHLQESRFPGGRLQPPAWVSFSRDHLSFPQCLLCARWTGLKCEG